MSRSPGPAKGSAGSASGGVLQAFREYLHISELPLTSLIFVMPLIILYEVGARYFAVNPFDHQEQRIVAFNLMQRFFAVFGATGQYLPPLAVIGILFCWHLARNDPWRLEAGTVFCMGLESILLGIPVLAIALLVQTYLPACAAARSTWPGAIATAIGAGIYEELVFRLILFTALSIVLVDLLKTEKVRASLLIVALTSVAFAAYHYLGNERFVMRFFVDRTLFGVYFGAIFLSRGFGVTVGAHASYDIFHAILQRLPHQ